VVHQVLATILILPFLLPLIAIVATSFGGQGALANYTAVITQTPFLRFIVNSLVISAGTIAIVFTATMLAGYALAKLRFTGRSLIFNAILVGLVLPGIALIVPMFIFVQRLGLFNNYLAVILPLCAVIIPFTLLLTRNYLRGVPDELLEAAKIDGATSFRALIHVVLPLSRPIIAVIIVWAFLNSWNEFFLPLLFLQDPNMQAVTQVPTYFTSTYGSDQTKIFASLVLMSLPIVIAYLSLQKFFERGLTAGAVK
jgi:ABC-type glycerol-3-phosphate transport system permease component